MADETAAPAASWNVLLVEDEAAVRRQVNEYLTGEEFASGRLNIQEITVLDQALNLIRERKADIVVLDVYTGAAQRGGERTGVRVLERIQESGFVPVILYTALPEGLESYRSSFIRLVGKQAGGLARLKAEIGDLFRLRIPQTNRAIANHLDQALSGYMWRFVQPNWASFEPLVQKPEFLRMILQRLAIALAREGIEKVTAEVFGPGAAARATDPGSVHPAEYYIKPPLTIDPVLGDIFARDVTAGREYLVVLWPSCDMVSTGGRTPKADRVLCAAATLMDNVPEITEWVRAPNQGRQDRVARLMRNARDSNFGSAERYHYLPGVWDIPDLVVDFQRLEHVDLTALRGLDRLASLASPFAEAFGTRFRRYLGRPGTPDLDIDTVLVQLREKRGIPEPGGKQ